MPAVIGAVELATDALERGCDLFLGVFDADALSRVVRWNVDDGRLWAFAHIGAFAGVAAARELNQQVHDALSGHGRHIPIHAALVALSGLGR